VAYWYHQVKLIGKEPGVMEAIAAAGVFIGLFGLWVLLPKKLLKK
jgi:hypothetical protein